MTGTLISAQSLPGLVLLGIAVLASLNLFYRDRPVGEDPLHLAMTVMGRVIIVTGFVEGCLVFLNVFAIPFWIVLAGVLVYVAFRYWLRRRFALLAVMAAASRRWMPLAPAVEALSFEWRGFFGSRCRQLAAALRSGSPLSQALAWTGPFVPGRAMAIIAVGERTGNVSGALAEAARQPATQPTIMRVWAALWYLGALALFGASILTFMAIKIVPAFIKIFDDFEADLPGMTVVLIQSCDWFVNYGWPPVVLSAFGIVCLTLMWTFDVIAWLPPPLSNISRRRQTVAVLRSLAIATEADRPMELALSALADHYPTPVLRGRANRALAQMALGQSWHESLADQGLLRRSELALLTSAERVGNLTWALREVADGIERRFALRAQRWLEVLVPIAVLAAGAVVMFIVVALFVPLVSLIEKLT